MLISTRLKGRVKRQEMFGLVSTALPFIRVEDLHIHVATQTTLGSGLG